MAGPVVPLGEYLKGFWADSALLTEIDPSTTEAHQGKTSEALYTNLVAALKLHSNPILSRLGRHIWDVVGSQHATVTITTMVPSTCFVVLRKEGIMHSFILIPPDWPRAVKEQPVMQFGAVIMTGSQAVDFYNERGKVESVTVINDRGMAYEAEMLKAVPTVSLNPYQKQVLQKFPNGFEEQRFGYSYRSVAGSVA